jgi:hypothetical protein
MRSRVHRLVGSWRLEACEAVDSDGTVLFPLGPQAVGILIYTADGSMSVAIMKGDRPRFAASDILGGTREEKALAAEGFLSYSGRYEVLGSRVRHTIEVSLFPNWVGSVQERIVDLGDDTLVLKTDPIPLGGRTRVAQMRWRRLRTEGAA